MNRLRYIILLYILKIKGIKKAFEQSPINYQGLRKNDVYVPKNKYFKDSITKTFTISNSTITEINQNSDELILFIHGGAFISGPAQHHWNTIEKIAKKVNKTIWLCNYPKAPEHKLNEISDNIDSVYNLASLKFEPEKISIIADSVGATLTVTLVQRLVINKLSPPSKIFLISPVMDCSMENLEIDNIEHKDPMLSKKGVMSANSMCSNNGNLKNPLMSPIFGTFDKFPLTYLFMAENDITFPDQIIFSKKLKEFEVKSIIIKGENMPHIWPLLPLMRESKTALNLIIEELNLSK
ncbi:alpha/beta hydrolase [Flavobacterium sp. TBRC 19031]|uniref:alpha/beta hydrolase n=1 Tax=Flavobacterium mekongense TaxID=3379707 RepID=UPI00399B7C18